MLFIGQWLRRVRHAETEKKKRKKKGPFGQCVWQRNTLERRVEAERAIRPFFGVSSRESKTQKRKRVLAWVVQSEWRDREKHNESVREWKRKRRHFSLLKLHTRKINWWSSHGVFEYYNHGELEYLEEDFATGFVVRLYLLLEIYLLYIQFIVDTSLS